MNTIANKLQTVCSEMVAERGPLWFFGLLLREEAIDRWDLVIAGSWTDPMTKDALEYVANKLRKYLEPDELVRLSRIVLMPWNGPVVYLLTRAIQTDNDVVEIENRDFSGLTIRRGFIFESHPTQPPAMTVGS